MASGFPSLFGFWVGSNPTGAPAPNYPSGARRLLLEELQLEIEKSLNDRKRKLEPKAKQVKVLRRRVQEAPEGPRPALLEKLGRLEREVQELSARIDTDVMRSALEGLKGPDTAPFIAFVRKKGLGKELDEAQRILLQAEDLQIMAALKEVLK